MLVAPGILGVARGNRASTAPFIHGGVAMRFDLLAVPQKSQAVWIFLDSIDGSVEVGGFAVGREDIGV